MITKKSQVHLEMVISFVIFIVFLMAILFFLNPLDQKRVSFFSFDSVQEKLISNISDKYDYYSLILDAEPSKSCIKIDNSINLDSSTTILFTDGLGNLLGSRLLSSENKIEIEVPISSEKRFFNVYVSNSFNQTTLSKSGCENLNQDDFSFSQKDIRTTAFYNKLFLFNSSYMSNYNELRKQLGIQDDFNFAVYYLNRTIVMSDSLSKKRPLGVRVMAREIPINIMDSDAQKHQFIISIRVW